jgi:HK97 family phage major capsid protein
MLTVMLRKEAGEFLDEAKVIQKKADDENRKLTEEEDTKIKALLSDAREKVDDAKNREAIEQLDAERRASMASLDNDLGSGDDGGVVSPKTSRVSTPATAKDVEEERKGGFKFFGDFACQVYRACMPGAAIDPRLIPLAAATGGSQGVPSDGGFLVPPSFGQMIWDGLRDEPDSMLGMTDQFTVDNESLSFPANAETSRTNGILYGGVKANWLAEASQIANTRPKFRRIKLEPQELAVLIFETDKLIRNSPFALEQFLSRAATAAINFNVGDAIINGDGSGKPLGILNSSALVTVAKEAGQAADTVVFNNIVKMFARMHAVRRGNAVWLINQDIEPQLWNLTQEGTSTSTPVFLPAGAGQFGGAAGAPLATLLGRPIMPTEHAQTLGDVGDIILTDLSAYATGIRGGGLRADTSIHLRFDFAETAFRFMFEVDGKPWLLSALTPANSANTLSTMVTLAART